MQYIIKKNEKKTNKNIFLGGFAALFFHAIIKFEMFWDFLIFFDIFDIFELFWDFLRFFEIFC